MIDKAALRHRAGRRLSRVVLAGLLITGPAFAQSGLTDALRAAESFDSSWAAAQRSHRAAQESYPIARSGLLPSLSLGGSYGRSTREIEQGDVTDERYYSQTTMRLQLRQPLVNLERSARVRIAEQEVMLADVTLRRARQDLISRVTSGYFGLLLAQERVALAAAQAQAFEAQRTQAEKLWQGGVATRTDVLEATAQLDRVRAEQIAARNQLEIARRTLRAMTGPGFDEVSALGDQVVFLPPQPAELSAWIDRAVAEAPRVLERFIARDRAEENLGRVRAQHLPTIDAVASYDRTGNADLGYDRDEIGRVGVELSLPLYLGGRINAESREAAARLDQSDDELTLSKREAELEASTAYAELTNSLARIEALTQAVASAQTALDAAQISFGVAYRTFVDVLNAEQLLYRSRFDLLSARFDYINALVRLHAAVGDLDETLIQRIDGWLIASERS